VTRLNTNTAFWALATILGALLFASAVPSPLYPVYQAQWDFSSLTLTGVFAVYALALLGALLTVGSISDHIGRKPTLVAALSLEIVSMVAFAGAEGVGWLFVARTLQGIATGTAMGAISAALLDLQPKDKPWLGGLMGAVGPLTGLALGALAAGLLVDYGPDPTRLVFWLLIGVFAAGIAVALAIPETVARDGRWRSSLRPQVAVPSELRAGFVAALPSLAATWALGGLVLSLGASVTAGVLGESSHLTAALPIFAMCAISAIVSVRVRHVDAGTTARGGLIALIAGLGLAVAGVAAESEALFLAGAAVAGLGFGPSFAGVFRALTERAPADRRGSLVSSILIVSYISFSLPAVIAGVAVTEIGLKDTAEIYGATLIAIAALALALSGNLDERPDPTAHRGGGELVDAA
jgi:MFS family permease